MHPKTLLIIILNIHSIYILYLTFGLSFFKVLLMELVELSNKLLAVAMFEKLELPKPVYFVCRLEQGGYMLVVEFYPIKEDLCVSSGVRDELRYQAPYLRMGSQQ